MAENLLSDSDVWGSPAQSAPSGLLSDDDVWGTPKPKEQRGAVAEIGRQIVGGIATRAPGMIGSALEWWAPQGSALEDAGRVAKEYWTEKEKAWEPDLEGRGVISSTLIKGAAQLGPSLAGMGAAMINPVLGGAAVATIFGGQQAQDTYDKGIKAGLSETDASEAAYKTGLIEGFGETVADVAGAKLLTGTGKMLSGLIGKGGMSGAIRAATDPRMAAQFAKDWAANAGIQSGTEFGQGYGEAAVEKTAGISTEDPLQQGAEGAQTALGMSVLLGPLAAVGHRSAAKKRAMIGDALNDPSAPLPIRMAAGEYVAKDIEPTVGKEAAQSWLQSFHEAAVQDRDAQQQPAAAPDVATQPKPTGLPGYQPGPPLVVFPDGSTMTGAEAEQRRLDSMVQRAQPTDILAAPNVDAAIAAAVDSVAGATDSALTLPAAELLNEPITPQPLAQNPTPAIPVTDLPVPAAAAPNVAAQPAPDLPVGRLDETVAAAAPAPIVNQQGEQTNSDLWANATAHWDAPVTSNQSARSDGSDAVVGDGGMTILHGSGNANMTAADVQIIRQNGQKQGKKGRTYGGLYGTSEADAAQAEGYANMMGGEATLYNIRVRPGTKVLNKTGDITRLSEKYINELVSQGYGVVVGKDPRGRTEYVVIDTKAIESMQPNKPKGSAAPNVDSYLKQNAAGKWQLSRPVELAVKDAVIAEMDRRNQEGTANADQAAESPLPAMPQEARQGAPLPEQVADGTPSRPAPQAQNSQQRPVVDRQNLPVPEESSNQAAGVSVPAVAGEGSDRGAVKVGDGGTAIPAFADIRQPKEDIREVAAGLSNSTRIVGNKTLPIDSLTGGVGREVGDRKRVDALAAKLKQPGSYFERIIADDAGNVIEGQHRLEALRSIGAKEVPAVVIQDFERNFPVARVKAAINAAQKMPSDNANQLTSNLAEIYADENGNLDEVAQYETPKGFEKAWSAAIDALKNPEASRRTKGGENSALKPSAQKDPEASRPNPVAESQALEIPSDGGVAPTQDKAVPAITRTKAGKLEISGFTREDVADSLKTAKIKATVAVGKDGRVLVSAVGRSGNPAPLSIKQGKAIESALMGKTAKAPKKRKFTGNLRNDVNLLAPGLYAEVARGGDGEAMGLDMSLAADQLRGEGFMLPTTETGKDSDAVIELIRQDIANGGGTLNEARQTAAMTEAEQKAHRADVLRMANEYGVETKRKGFPRKFTDIEAEVKVAIEQEVVVAGKSLASIREQAIKEGISADEVDAIMDQIADFYDKETSPDKFVLMYREAANQVQERIDGNQEQQGRDGQGSGTVEHLSQGAGSEERPALELAGQTPAEAQAELDRRKAISDQERAEAAEAARKERAARDQAEKDRRAAAVIAEDKARRDAEIAGLQNPDDFQFGADAPAAPAPVIKKVSTEQARGQGDVFAQPRTATKTIPLSSITINIKQHVVDTGKTITTKEKADVALRDIREQIKIAKDLKICLGL